MLIVSFIFLALAVFILIKSADYTIEAIEKVGLKLKVPTFILSSIFLAAATSFPELFVGVMSAVDKEPILSLGNVLGANLVDLTLILGLTTIISNGVKVKEKMIFKDLLVTFLIALIPFLFLYDGTISKKEGLISILIYIFYQFVLIGEERSISHRRHPDHSLKHIGILAMQLTMGIVILAGSAQLVVNLSERISGLLNIPLTLIGILFLSLGTTLPEMIVELKSAEAKEDGIFFGNVLGSIVVNSLLVLGIAAFIYPIEVNFSVSLLRVGGLTLLVFILLPIFLRSKKTLERKEGFFLLSIYVIFLLSHFLVKGN